MNDIFVVYIRHGDTSVYIDNVIIGAKSDPTGKLDNLKFHEQSVQDILEVFREHKLYLKLEKCEFLKTQVEYLGFVITGDHVMMDPIKVDEVKSWPVPTNLKQLCSFISFINFYWRFIKEFSHIAQPLHELTKINIKWTWNKEHQDTFDKLKDLICDAPVLTYPDPEKPYMVETNASNYAVGVVLSQKQDNGKWHPIAYLSKSMDEHQQNYDIHDKEL